MLVTFIRILIGILFVVSSVSKAIEIENFSFLLMSFGSKNWLNPIYYRIRVFYWLILYYWVSEKMGLMIV
jgi:hypothetical protein